MKFNKKHIFILSTLLLLGCKKEPASECLESFRLNLVSPNSAKVLSFDGRILSYLAKNRNGVEIQGKAICSKIGGSWVRNGSAEHVEILNHNTNALRENNECRASGNQKSYCDEIHPKYSIELSRINLGYN